MVRKRQKGHEIQLTYGYQLQEETTGLSFDAYDWGEDAPLCIPYEDAVMYHLHVRNFTRHSKSNVRHKGTFLGLQEKIPYLLELGINQVKLMPIYELAPPAAKEPEGLSYRAPVIQPAKENFWGYGAGNYFWPRKLYAATKNPAREVKDMVRCFHQNGIEVLLEMFFQPDTPLRIALDCLIWWVEEYHIDGFHIMGNDLLGKMLASDPLLTKTKILVGEAGGCAQNENSFKKIAECNDGFLVDARRLLKGDEGMTEAFAYRSRRNPADYGVINYITNHDGFTLQDLVSYDNRHNEENGERNQDGADYNFSWNCGVEGPSRKKAITALRAKQMKNAFLMLLLAQGTPMLLAGDEFGNSQGGNNNPYCLDNRVSWVDWNAWGKNRQLAEFVKKAIAFRKEHRILHLPQEIKLADYRSCGCPDLSYHSGRAWYGGFEYNSRQLGMLYCGKYAQEDEFLYIVYNLHPQEQELALPPLSEGRKWQTVIDTSQEQSFVEQGEILDPGVCKSKRFPARSIVVFVGKKV